MKTCDEKLDCINCPSHDSWSGAACRWCPLNRECHGHMSLVNPCKRQQNIKMPSDCNSKTYGRYNPYMAYQLALFSAAAYSADPQTCLAQILPDSDFEVVDIMKGSCDDFLFDYEECFVYIAVSCEKKTILEAFGGTENQEQVLISYQQFLLFPNPASRLEEKFRHISQMPTIIHVCTVR